MSNENEIDTRSQNHFRAFSHIKISYPGWRRVIPGKLYNSTFCPKCSQHTNVEPKIECCECSSPVCSCGHCDCIIFDHSDKNLANNFSQTIHDHKKRLNKLQIEYLGTRKPSGKSPRTANCYSCGKDLDNAIDLECKQCGWMLCFCGACGCGYTQNRT